MIPPPIGPDLPGEIWKPIPGHEAFAEVSNMGRIRSTPRKLGGEVTSGRGRYLCANLSGPVMGYGNQRSRKRERNSTQAWKVPIHRIVAAAFLGKPPARLTQINHKDGNKLNNQLSNLEYCTVAENIRHAYNHGLNMGMKRGRKLTPQQYDEIRSLYRRGGWTHDTLAVKFEVSATHIGYVLHRSLTRARKSAPSLAR